MHAFGARKKTVASATLHRMDIPPLEDWLGASLTVRPESTRESLFGRLQLVAELLREAPGEGPKLLWRDGRGHVMARALAGSIVVGRESACDLMFADPKLSRRHCTFERDGSDWRLRDLESTNGTLVNGQKIKEHLLRDGDTIEAGVQLLVFVGSQAAS